MIRSFLPLSLIVACVGVVAPAAMAQEFSVTKDMQRCTTADDCGLITNDCAKPCGFIPVNKSATAALSKAFGMTCKQPLENVLPCEPSSMECVQGLCVKTSAMEQSVYPKDATQPVEPAPAPAVSSTAPATPVAPTAPEMPAPSAPTTEYQPGAYNVSEPATPSKVQGDYSRVNDRDGKFTAYDLPQTDVKQKDVGQIVDRIYVPADAPVQGGKYVPVTPTTSPAPVAAPAVPVVAPAPAPAVAPPVVPAAPTKAQPMDTMPKPMSDVPVMTPTKPGQMPAGLAPVEPQAPVAPTAPAPAATPSAEIPSEFNRAMVKPEGGVQGPVDAKLTPMEQEKVEAVVESTAAAPEVKLDDKKSFTIKTDKKPNQWKTN